MNTEHDDLPFTVLPQPDDRSCGPTCLHSVYRYYGDDLPLKQVIAEVHRLPNGGTMSVMLANHAMRRGYRARIYTYNLRLFDPTWMQRPELDLADCLRRQAEAKPGKRLRTATEHYLEFLARGGQVRMEDLTLGLIRRYLRRGIPILTGLSSTYLYRTAREYGDDDHDDDIRGEPAGHFVVLCGYDTETRCVRVADPYHPNPISGTTMYHVDIARVSNAVLLGTVTYDANLLILEPGHEPTKEHTSHGDPSRR